MTRRLVRALQSTYWLLLAWIFPLVFDPRVFYLHRGMSTSLLLPAKAVILEAALLAGVLAALTAFPNLRLSSLPRLVLKARPWAKWLLGFLVVAFVGTAFQQQATSLSLTGSAARLDGVLFEASWLLLALLSAALIESGVSNPAWAVTMFAYGALPTAAMAVLKGFGVDTVQLILPRVTILTASSGTFMGHPGMVSGYLAFLGAVFFSFRLASRRMDWTASATLLILSAGVFGVGGRAAVIAYVVALAVAAALLWPRDKWQAALLRLVAPVLLGAAVMLAFGQYAQQRFDRFNEAVNLSGVSVQDRAIVFKAGLRSLKHMPLFGYGPDGFANVVWSHVSSQDSRKLLRDFIPRGEIPTAIHKGKVLIYRDTATGEWRTMDLEFDKAHNYLLDLTLASGLLGGLLFVGFGIAALTTLARSDNEVSKAAGVGLLFFMVFGLAWFMTMNYDPTVWAVVGIGLGAAGSRAGKFTEGAG